MEEQKTPENHAIPGRKNDPGTITTPDDKLSYKITAVNTTWSHHKNKNVKQCNKKMEDQNMNSLNYRQLMLDRDLKHTHCRKDSIFSQFMLGKTGIPVVEE